MKRPNLLFVTKFSFSCLLTLAVNIGNSVVKNKMVSNGSILTGKKIFIQIFKINLNTKNNDD
jgi:hypothetical protein